MIDAIIGSIIAVIATGALALMAEVFSASQEVDKQFLTEYEKAVLDVVIAAHKSEGPSIDERKASQKALENWLAEQWKVGLSASNSES
jgi:hypothetical protein